MGMSLDGIKPRSETNTPIFPNSASRTWLPSFKTAGASKSNSTPAPAILNNPQSNSIHQRNDRKRPETTGSDPSRGDTNHVHGPRPETTPREGKSSTSPEARQPSSCTRTGATSSLLNSTHPRGGQFLPGPGRSQSPPGHHPAGHRLPRTQIPHVLKHR